MIPKTFHQIWLGPNSFPAQYKKYQKTWQKHHPQWEIRLWTEENLPPDLERKEIYERLRHPVERADMLRLEVVRTFGGVYIDTDFECLRSIEPLIGEVDLFVAYLDENRTNNAIIGAVPGHPFLSRAIKEASAQEYFGFDKTASGSLFLDSLVKEYDAIKIFPPYLFYPSTLLEREKAVAIHHADRAWKDDRGFRESALNAERRLFAVQELLVDVDWQLKQLQALEDLREVHSRLDKIRSSIASYLANPTKARLKSDRWWWLRKYGKGFLTKVRAIKNRW